MRVNQTAVMLGSFHKIFLTSFTFDPAALYFHLSKLSFSPFIIPIIVKRIRLELTALMLVPYKWVLLLTVTPESQLFFRSDGWAGDFSAKKLGLRLLIGRYTYFVIFKGEGRPLLTSLELALNSSPTFEKCEREIWVITLGWKTVHSVH